MSKTLALAEQLIAIPSITPEDKGCQAILIERLKALDFAITEIPYQDTHNFWAARGDAEPVFVFAGHTDVVTTGPLDHWSTPPFEPTIKEGFLYGRGAADMKGSLAAMIVACENFIGQYPQHKGTIGFIITSAEEGPSEQGTPQVLDYLVHQKQPLTWCIVGEPTAHEKVGDTLKNGRRGSLTGNLRIIGQQGHIAYPHLANNPIPGAMEALTELYQRQWDQGSSFFQPTSFQISNMHSGTGQGNVIPGEIDVLFNFRYCPEMSAAIVKQQTHEILDRHKLAYELEWTHYGKPFLTEEGDLIHACRDAIDQHQAIKPKLSTSGGTSDGRYIAEFCPQIIELGPCNDTIHQINECVRIEDLEMLTQIYQGILERLLLQR